MFGVYILVFVNILLVMAVCYMMKYPQSELVIMQTPPTPSPQPPPVETRPPPEYRPPPLKQYKPRHFQQMGVLTGDNGQIMPIYGRESMTHRDRYHYHTVSGGDQLYPLPLTVDGRRCDEDIGCKELYGGETATVLGVPGTFNTEIYRTENFIDRY